MWPAIIAIATIQAIPFTWGFRRSADEVAFLAAALDGSAAVKTLTVTLALEQGRLGLFASIPLNVLGAYLADLDLARWSFVALHFGYYILFSAYVAFLCRAKVAPMLTLLLISLQPICRANDYMPPLAYPLQNTVPFVLLIASRYALALWRRDHKPSPWLYWLALGVSTASMMTTEYAFLLGTTLLAFEYLLALARRSSDSPTVGIAISSLLRCGAFWQDAASVATALGAYAGFRWLHPSSYEGNVLDAGTQVLHVAATTVLHVHAGTVLSRPIFDVASLPWSVLATALGIGIASGLCAWVTVRDATLLAFPGLIAAFGVAAMVYITFPIAANARQQLWCLEHGACGYLDSRISYLWLMLVLLGSIAWIFRRLQTASRVFAFNLMAAALASAAAASTFANNWRDGQATKLDAEVWKAAALLACHPELEPASDALLVRMIDPERRARFHPGSDQAGFWRQYLAFEKAHSSCSPDEGKKLADLMFLTGRGPTAVPGELVQFTGLASRRYLESGWSAPEDWGTWSDGDQATVVFQVLRARPEERLTLQFDFRLFTLGSASRQSIDVLVNGRHADVWAAGPVTAGVSCCSATIDLQPLPAPDQLVHVTFRIRHPRRKDDPPQQETRRLGLGLVSMTLIANSGTGFE